MGDGAARTGSPGLQTNKETGPFGHLGNLESWDNKAIHHVCCPHPWPALVSSVHPGSAAAGIVITKCDGVTSVASQAGVVLSANCAQMDSDKVRISHFWSTII